MLKHAASAAARSSSGFEPVPLSKREVKLYCPPIDPLSDQERRILKLFADGSNATIIARKLDISAQTLRNHLHHINRKLRTHNRLEAVTHAQRRGLID